MSFRFSKRVLGSLWTVLILSGCDRQGVENKLRGVSCVFGCNSGGKTEESLVSPVPLDGRTYFASCQQLAEYQEYTKTLEGEIVSCKGDSVSANSTQSDDARFQSPGVDEDDMVKLSEHHIFIKRPGSVVVLSRVDQTEIGQIPTYDPVTHLYVYADKLVLLASENGTSRAEIYKLSAGQIPLLDRKINFAGNVLESRLIGSRLILTSRLSLSDSVNPADEHIGSPVGVIPKGGLVSPRCSNIVVPTRAAAFPQILAAYTLSLENLDQEAKSMGLIRDSGHTFVNSNQILISEATSSSDSSGTQLTQVLLGANGELSIGAVGRIAGYLKDRWALWGTKHDDAVFAATTVDDYSGQGFWMKNEIAAIKSNGTTWDVLSKIENLAPGEDIRAVRYVGDKAYVVTFKKTDPVYTIDLGEPRHLRVLGELKVPGFSTMLYPLADGRLLGVGFDALEKGDFAMYQGVQVSLFDARDPASVSLLGSDIIGSRGSSSEATFDSKAIHYDESTGAVGLPFVSVDSYSKFVESGAVFYQTSSAGLSSLIKVSQRDLVPQSCMDALSRGRSYWWSDKSTSLFDTRRILDVDGSLFTVSNFGWKKRGCFAGCEQC